MVGVKSHRRIDKRRGRGVIINVASMLGVKSTYWQEPYTAYTASKHAVVGLTRTVGFLFIYFIGRSVWVVICHPPPP